MRAEEPIAGRAKGDGAHRSGPVIGAERGVQLANLATPIGKREMVGGGWVIGPS